MGEAREQRAPFTIVVREVVNRFEREDFSEPTPQDGLLPAAIADTQRRIDETSVREAETLFDDSAASDEPPGCASAEDSRRQHNNDNSSNNNTNSSSSGRTSDNDNDHNDDAIFDEVETQAFAPRDGCRAQRRPTNSKTVGDPRTVHDNLECAFVTAAGKSTRVSYEALQAAKRKLEDETSPALPSPSPSSSSFNEVDTGFKSGRGNPVKVSAEALLASKKVFDHINDEPSPQHQQSPPPLQHRQSPPPPEVQPLPPPPQTDSASNAAVTVSPRRSAPAECPTAEAGKNGAAVLGFTTARGNIQKVSEKALREVCKMFQEELGEASDRDALLDEAGDGVEPPLATSSCLKDASDHENCAQLTANGRPPGGSRLSSVKSDAQSRSMESSHEKKTPLRRIAGLKRRTPMCQTALNRSSSPITPLRGPATSDSTPLRPNQQRKHPARKSRVLSSAAATVTAEEHTIELKSSNRIKLQDLTLMDGRPPAVADALWFQDDVSGRKVYLEDVKRTFRREINARSANFDPWFVNHFELVVWKLASYSGRVKELAGCLTVENVLDQLQHRWNVEVEAKRSPLRMIVERDAPSEATVVLLVKEVRSSSQLVLSDGWYSIPCDVDRALQRLVAKNRIRVGQKLCIHGAQLKGAVHGVDPLQLEDARLSIRFNSTRRARWFAKLGYLRQSFVVPLLSVDADGGCLPAIRVRVTSCSALMYFEKFSQGGSVIRREADELKEQRTFCEQMLAIQEKIREDVLRTLESEQAAKRKIHTRSQRKQTLANLTSGEEIFEAIENSLDPAQLIQQFTSSQKRMLESYQATVQDKLRTRVENETRRILDEMRRRNECPEDRKVAPLLKLMVCCSASNIEVPLTVWRPSEDLRSMLRVGATITIHDANVTTCRKFSFGLTTTKSTAFELSEESLEQQTACKQARYS